MSWPAPYVHQWCDYERGLAILRHLNRIKRLAHGVTMGVTKDCLGVTMRRLESAEEGSACLVVRGWHGGCWPPRPCQIPLHKFLPNFPDPL
jgi:hypothetical protein